MTPKEQEIAIAVDLKRKVFDSHQFEGRDENRYFECERCGECIGWSDYSKNKGIFYDKCTGPNSSFTSSLEDIFEACYSFTLEDITKFSNELMHIIKRDLFISSSVDARYLTVNASAAQRAEAYLRSKKKYIE